MVRGAITLPPRLGPMFPGVGECLGCGVTTLLLPVHGDKSVPQAGFDVADQTIEPGIASRPALHISSAWSLTH